MAKRELTQTQIEDLAEQAEEDLPHDGRLAGALADQAARDRDRERDEAARQRRIADDAEIQARALRKVGFGGRQDNVTSPQISTYNPQGDKDYPRPPLRYRKAFIPHQAEADNLSWEEIELLNLLKSGEYRVTMNDDSQMPLTVIVELSMSGQPDRLLFRSPMYTAENFRRVPRLRDLLREVCEQDPELKAKAASVLTMAERERRVKAGELPVSLGG